MGRPPHFTEKVDCKRAKDTNSDRSNNHFTSESVLLYLLLRDKVAKSL